MKYSFKYAMQCALLSAALIGGMSAAQAQVVRFKNNSSMNITSIYSRDLCTNYLSEDLLNGHMQPGESRRIDITQGSDCNRWNLSVEFSPSSGRPPLFHKNININNFNNWNIEDDDE